MSDELIGLIGLLLVVLFLLFKFWLGAAFILVGFLGYGYLVDWKTSLNVLGIETFGAVARYHITVIPMFILMGTIASNTGVSGDLFDTAYKWIGRLRGGVAMAAVASCGMFAAVSGSSVATAVTMGKVAIPEMKKYNYDMRLASGSVAAEKFLGLKNFGFSTVCSSSSSACFNAVSGFAK